MTAVFASVVLAALTSSEAVLTLLNSSNASSASRCAEAKALVEREARDGKPLQQFVIGVTTSDSELSKRYLEASRGRIEVMANNRNNALAWYLLSMEKNDMNLLRKAVAGGNVQALNAMGTIATQQALTKKNDAPDEAQAALKTSYECFCKAAAQRDPNGFVNVGTCYLRGLGCAVNMELAFESYMSAAEMGHPEGMDYVSACYEKGHGVEKSNWLSLFWRMRARAMRGDKAAEDWLKGKK